MPFHKPRAHEEDIARPKLGSLFCGDGFEVMLRNGVALNGGVVYVTGLGVGEVVEEDGAADDAAILRPFWISSSRFVLPISRKKGYLLSIPLRIDESFAVMSACVTPL